jgi:hypothetical protein
MVGHQFGERATVCVGFAPEAAFVPMRMQILGFSV